MSNVEKLLSSARDLMHQARLNQAINMCTAAIKEEPGNSQIYRLLGEISYLMENKNLVLTRDQIITNVWGYDYYGETNVVDVYVRHLRKKLGLKQTDSILHTCRGVGYSMKDSRK